MLVTDLDDTLLNSDNVISEQNIRAIQQMTSAGFHFVMASGRPLASVYQLAKETGCKEQLSYIIAYNGGVIYDLKREKVVYQQGLNPEDQETLISFLNRSPLASLTYDQQKIVINWKNDYTQIESELTGLPCRYDAEFFEQLNDVLPKMMGVGDPKIVQQIYQDYSGRFGQATRLTISKPFYLEIVHQEVSKGRAIEEIAQLLNLELSEIIGMGDSYNDLEMLQTSGKAVVVENGHPELKKIAAEIAPSNDYDGVAYIIKKYFIKD